jgi:hypothetical protein
MPILCGFNGYNFGGENFVLAEFPHEGLIVLTDPWIRIQNADTNGPFLLELFRVFHIAGRDG